MEPLVRRGLPRVAGGDAWPPEGTPAPPTEYAFSAAVAPAAAAPAAVPPPLVAAPVVAPEVAPLQAAPAATVTGPVRRGLPRVAGGEPWPPEGTVAAGVIVATASAAPTAVAPAAVELPTAEVAAPAEVAASPTLAAAAPPVATTGGAARRGLPREAGGTPWPPAGTQVAGAFAAIATTAAPAHAPVATPIEPVVEAPAPVRRQAMGTAPATPAAPVAAKVEPAAAAPVAPTAAVPAVAATPPAPVAPVAKPAPATPAPAKALPAKTAPAAAKAEPKKYGLFTIKQWVGVGAVLALAVVGAVTLVVMAARWFVGLDFMQTFIAAYPGEYHLPESAPIGFPGWLGWQHFFNIFLMVLIIRSGWLVRTQERPEAFWASKKNPKKISINLWLHQGLNILWVVNGAIFLILLFATGQWMRVIPTSWEVFPNAVSAGLQYLTLVWPLDNGWVNYNSLQQLAYFTTIFIAAPISAITGYRMSEAWPRRSTLSDRFPVEWARKLHFPTMIYFVAFIVVHVALVFTTGALRNLNHMFAAQGSIDPTTYANNWVGFWWFVGAMVVVVAGWVAARPMVLAPIARIFGSVSAR